MYYANREQRDKHYTFEDPKSASSDFSSTSATAQEWLEAIDRANKIAISQSMVNHSYSIDDALTEVQSGVASSQTPNLVFEGRPDNNPAVIGRNNLKKHSVSKDADESKGFKRFSKRQSKSGISSVF